MCEVFFQSNKECGESSLQTNNIIIMQTHQRLTDQPKHDQQSDTYIPPMQTLFADI